MKVIDIIKLIDAEEYIDIVTSDNVVIYGNIASMYNPFSVGIDVNDCSVNTIFTSSHYEDLVVTICIMISKAFNELPMWFQRKIEGE